MLQKARKDGHLRVPRLQFLRRDQRGLHMRRTVVDSQPWDSQMTIFSCLLQYKGAPIFQIKQPLFWKKRQISASLAPPIKSDHLQHRNRTSQDIPEIKLRMPRV